VKPLSLIRTAALTTALCGVVLAATPTAQTTTRRAASSLSGVPHVASVAVGTGATELTIRWTVTDSAGDEPVPGRDLRPLNQFALLTRRAVTPAFVRERAPQLNAGRLVVLTVDASGREVAWQQLLDPRIVRAETPGPTGELTGQTLYRPVTELMVTLPDALAAVAVRVYEVQWNGAEFLLQQLGEVAVGAR
jgi:hypothetical protein